MLFICGSTKITSKSFKQLFINTFAGVYEFKLFSEKFCHLPSRKPNVKLQHCQLPIRWSKLSHMCSVYWKSTMSISNARMWKGSDVASMACPSLACSFCERESMYWLSTLKELFIINLLLFSTIYTVSKQTITASVMESFDTGYIWQWPLKEKNVWPYVTM